MLARPLHQAYALNAVPPLWRFDAQGWCAAADVCASPNFGARPDGVAISLLVIHNVSLPKGQFGGRYILDLFQNQLDYEAHSSFNSLRGLRVSSHFLIRRDGQLVQCVSSLARAWHAGESQFLGQTNCNDFSIGIELEGCDELAFEAVQYQSLLSLTQSLLAHYPIMHIAGHQEIAPTRKTDPGPHFDWSAYRHALAWV